MIKWSMQNMIWSGRLIAAVILIITFNSCSEKGDIDYPSSANYEIIPKPQSIGALHGFFLLNNATIVADQELEMEAREFADFVNDHLQTNVEYSADKNLKQAIVLSLLEEDDFKTEGYRLLIEKKSVKIESNTKAGISRALSTLKQLAMRLGSMRVS